MVLIAPAFAAFFLLLIAYDISVTDCLPVCLAGWLAGWWAGWLGSAGLWLDGSLMAEGM